MRDMFGVPGFVAAAPVVVVEDCHRRRAVASWFEITRPANNTQYTAHDVINEDTAKLLEFKNIVRKPGAGFEITNALVLSDFTPATYANMEIIYFDAPILGPADHATLTLTPDMLKHVIGLSKLAEALVTTSGTIYYRLYYKPFFGRVASDQTSVWAILKTASAYTPGTSENIRVLINGYEYD